MTQNSKKMVSMFTDMSTRKLTVNNNLPEVFGPFTYEALLAQTRTANKKPSDILINIAKTLLTSADEMEGPLRLLIEGLSHCGPRIMNSFITALFSTLDAVSYPMQVDTLGFKPSLIAEFIKKKAVHILQELKNDNTRITLLDPQSYLNQDQLLTNLGLSLDKGVQTFHKQQLPIREIYANHWLLIKEYALNYKGEIEPEILIASVQRILNTTKSLYDKRLLNDTEVSERIRVFLDTLNTYLTEVKNPELNNRLGLLSNPANVEILISQITAKP